MSEPFHLGIPTHDFTYQCRSRDYWAGQKGLRVTLHNITDVFHTDKTKTKTNKQKKRERERVFITKTLYLPFPPS